MPPHEPASSPSLQLAESRVHSPADFFDQLDKDGSLAGWVSRNTPHWKTEEKEGTELHEVTNTTR